MQGCQVEGLRVWALRLGSHGVEAVFPFIGQRDAERLWKSSAVNPTLKLTPGTLVDSPQLRLRRLTLSYFSC